MSSARPELRLDWCSHKAARYAVEHWHYSRRMPAGKLVMIGVWEGGRYVGCVLFGRGANNHVGTPFGLGVTQICELVRVALSVHVAPVSRIVSIAIRMLKRQSPGLQLVVSYADPDEGHNGGIYQAMGWTYVGASRPQRAVRVAGEWMHKRAASSRWGTASPSRIRAMSGANVEYGPVQWKHSYLYPLDSAMRAQIAPLAKPYPKRASEPTGVGAGDQPVQGGSIPTRTLTQEPAL